jgi:quercetin dioxygenase-like cupin family protein
MAILLRADQTDGRLVALSVDVPAGEGPPLHVHGREEETVFIVAGDFRWKLGDELKRTPVGSFVFIPRGVPHTFQNVGDEQGSMLITFAPAGMEGFFERLAERTTFDLDAFRQAGSEFGMDVLGPPLAQSNPLS